MGAYGEILIITIMIYKITLSVSGDNFCPSKIESDLLGNFEVVDCFNPSDKILEDTEQSYEYGGISIWHPKKFTLQEHILEYETFFVQFSNQNYQTLMENGATELKIYYEIYHKDEHCNFEVLNPASLKKLTSFNVSIPISIYRLKKKEFHNWSKEIKSVWNKENIKI